MKNILITLTIILTVLSCKAQQPVIDLYKGSDYLETNNAYYKDVDGDFTKLIGTWEYTNGSEVFKIILKKKNQEPTNILYRNISYYKDVIYGEFQYIDENGTEIVNTLSNIDNEIDLSEHLIYGGYINSVKDKPVCEVCPDNERRVYTTIEDPLRPYFYYDMVIRHIPMNPFSTTTTEQLIIKIERSMGAFIPQGQPSDDRILIDEITLVKQ